MHCKNNNLSAFKCYVFAAYNLERCAKACLWSLCATSKVVQNNVLKLPPGSILVYRNIVTNKIVGNVTGLLLAVLPLPAKRKLTKFTPAKLEYQRVKARQLTNISIKFADFNEKSIEFYNDQTILLVKLHYCRAPVSV